MAFLEEKEKERQAIIDKFNKAITAIASPQAIDSTALEASINEAIVELASERAGQEITKNPEAFLVRIKKLVDDIKIGTQQIEIVLNPSDLAQLKVGCKTDLCQQVGSLYLIRYWQTVTCI